MPARPAGKICRGAFLEIGLSDQFAKHVVAVEFDKRIQVQHGHANASDHHDLVRQVVRDHARRGRPPDDRAHKANDQVTPDPGDDGGDPLPLAAVNPDLGNIAKEAGRKIHQ